MIGVDRTYEIQQKIANRALFSGLCDNMLKDPLSKDYVRQAPAQVLLSDASIVDSFNSVARADYSKWKRAWFLAYLPYLMILCVLRLFGLFSHTFAVILELIVLLPLIRKFRVVSRPVRASTRYLLFFQDLVLYQMGIVFSVLLDNHLPAFLCWLSVLIRDCVYLELCMRQS